MKALIIYHANCDDGFGAAWVAHKALTAKGIYDSVSLHEGVYNQPPPYEKVDQETEVFIVDFSYPMHECLAIFENAGYTTILDHHKTALENLQLFIDSPHPKALVIFDMKRSGAGMTWDYFHYGKDRPRLIHHIEDNDLWRFALPSTKEVILALRSYPQTLGHWDDIARNFESSPTELIGEGFTIKRYYDQKLLEVAKNASKVIIAGPTDEVHGLICNANMMFASDLGNLLAKQSGGIGISWYENDKKEAVFSLRSIGDTIDVSAIAKCYGGGGHKNAAGFKLSPSREGAEFGNNEFGTTMIWHTNG